MGVGSSTMQNPVSQSSFHRPAGAALSQRSSDSVSTDTLKNILQQAGVDTAKVPKEVLQSPDLLQSLASKKLLTPSTNTPARNEQIHEVVAQMSAQHRQGKELSGTVDLTNLSEFKKVVGSLVDKLNQNEPGFKGATGEYQQSLNKLLSDPSVGEKEKLSKAGDLLEKMSGAIKSDKKHVSPEAEMLSGVGKYAKSAQTRDKISVDTKNAFDEMSGLVIDTKSRKDTLDGFSKKIGAADSELGAKLKDGFEKITNDPGLSRKEQTQAAAQLLRNEAGGKRTEPFAEMLKMAVSLENGVSKQQFGDTQKAEISDINSQVYKLIDDKDPDSVRTLRDLKEIATFVSDTPFMSNKAKNAEMTDVLREMSEQPELQKDENKALKEKITKLADSLGEQVKSEEPKKYELKLSDKNHASFTPAGEGNRTKVDVAVNGKIPGIGGGGLGVTTNGSHLQKLSANAEIPVHPGVTVGGKAEYKTDTAQAEQKIVTTTSMQGGPKVTVGDSDNGVTVGANGSRVKETTFDSKMHVLENVPVDPEASKAAFNFPGSKLSSETLKELKQDATELNAVRDGTEKLSDQLKRAGIIQQDLKVPSGYSAAAAMDVTTTSGSVEVGLKTGGKMALGVAVSGESKATTEIGDRMDALQNNPDLMAQNLKRFKMDDVSDALKKSEELKGDSADGIIDLDKLKTRVKQMILENLGDAQNYQGALRQTTKHSKEDTLSQKSSDPAEKRFQAQFDKQAKLDKKEIQKDYGTGGETRTLDKMLVKHAALMQAYENIETAQNNSGRAGRPTKPISTRLESFDAMQQSNIQALNLAVSSKVDKKAANDAQFGELLKDADQQLRSPNATIGLNTLKQLQKVTPESTEKHFKVDVSFPGFKINADVASKPAMKAGEQSELTATVQTENLLSQVLGKVVDKLQNNDKIQSEEPISDSAKTDNKETAKTFAESIKSDWKGSSKLEVGFKDGKFDHVKAETSASVRLGTLITAPKIKAEANIELTKQKKPDNSGETEMVRTSHVKLDIDLKMGDKLAEALAGKLTKKEGEAPEELVADLKKFGSHSTLEVDYEKGKFKSSSLESKLDLKAGPATVQGSLKIEHKSVPKEGGADGETEIKRDSTYTAGLNAKLTDGMVDKIDKEMFKGKMPEGVKKDLKAAGSDSSLEVKYENGKFASSTVTNKTNISAGPSTLKGSVEVAHKSVPKEGGADGETEIKRDTTYKLDVGSKLTEGMIGKIGDKFFEGNIPEDVKKNLEAAKNDSSLEVKYEGGEFKSSSVSTQTHMQVAGMTADVSIARTVKAEEDENGDVKNKPETTIKIKANQEFDQSALDKFAKKLEKEHGVDLGGKLTLPPAMQNVDLADLEIKIADGKTEVSGTVLGKALKKS